jgi:hypothetical protein
MNGSVPRLPHTASSPAEAAYVVLRELISAQHGDIATTAALCMLRLMSFLMGMSGPGGAAAATGAKRGAAQEVSQRRAAAVQFIKWLCE